MSRKLIFIQRALIGVACIAAGLLATDYSHADERRDIPTRTPKIVMQPLTVVTVTRVEANRYVCPPKHSMHQSAQSRFSNVRLECVPR